MTARTWTAAEIQAKAEEVVCRYAEFRRLLDGTYSGDMRRALAAVFPEPEPEPVVREEPDPDPNEAPTRWRMAPEGVQHNCFSADDKWREPSYVDWFTRASDPHLPARLRLIADLVEYPYKHPVTGEKMTAKKEEKP